MFNVIRKYESANLFSVRTAKKLKVLYFCTDLITKEIVFVVKWGLKATSLESRTFDTLESAFSFYQDLDL